jgi:predicted anti-sigma-YlaC factor YlaD
MKRQRNAHLNQDELLDRMYGLGEDHVAHLQDCEECSVQIRALERKRAEVVAASSRNEAAVSNEFLLAQRRAIYARVGQTSVTRARWVPASLAVAFLLVMGVFLVQPRAQHRAVSPAAPAVGVPVTHAQTNEEQLFSDLYSMEQSVEPRAGAPIRALFEGSEEGTEQ